MMTCILFRIFLNKWKPSNVGLFCSQAYFSSAFESQRCAPEASKPSWGASKNRLTCWRTSSRWRVLVVQGCRNSYTGLGDTHLVRPRAGRVLAYTHPRGKRPKGDPGKSLGRGGGVIPPPSQTLWGKTIERSEEVQERRLHINDLPNIRMILRGEIYREEIHDNVRINLKLEHLASYLGEDELEQHSNDSKMWKLGVELLANTTYHNPPTAMSATQFTSFCKMTWGNSTVN